MNCKPNLSQNNSKGANRRTNENHEPREKGARFFGYLGFVLVCNFCVPKLEFNCSYLIYLVHFLKLLWQTSETKSRRLSSHNLIRPGLHPVARGWPYMCLSWHRCRMPGSSTSASANVECHNCHSRCLWPQTWHTTSRHTSPCHNWECQRQLLKQMQQSFRGCLALLACSNNRIGKLEGKLNGIREKFKI